MPWNGGQAQRFERNARKHAGNQQFPFLEPCFERGQGIGTLCE
jgi:hypothetical protein